MQRTCTVETYDKKFNNKRSKLSLCSLQDPVEVHTAFKAEHPEMSKTQASKGAIIIP